MKHRPRSIEEIEYFENIRYEDQQSIQKKIDKFNAILAPQEGGGAGSKRKAEESGPLSDYGVEYSLSGRAQCVGCRNKIMKDELRVKKIVYHTDIGKNLKFQSDLRFNLLIISHFRHEIRRTSIHASSRMLCIDVRS